MSLTDRVWKAGSGATTMLTTGAGTALRAGRNRNIRLLLNLMGPAMRGFILDRGSGENVEVPAQARTWFNWTYEQENTELQRLYKAAKRAQWDAEKVLDWSIDVDPSNERRPLIQDQILPLRELSTYRKLNKSEKQEQRHAILSWLLSQFLHGEQGALLASCQVTEGTQDMDAKLFGSTQVVDEGRHVEVFHRYLVTKLEKAYPINQNLYVILDALLCDDRWDIKFLGMQIMVEGLALGAFSTIRAHTREPLLKRLLRYVIKDEARHVHYGVVSLRDFYTQKLDEAERRDREDWAFEISRHMRNRFLAHEFYDEYYSHLLSRTTWNKLMLESDFMAFYRRTMFKRVIPNLKRIGLMTERVYKHYEDMGLSQFENEKAADELTLKEIMEAEKPIRRRRKRKPRRKKKPRKS